MEPTQQVVAVLARKYGLDVSAYSESHLANTLTRRVAAVASSSPDAYLEFLAGNRTEADEFVAALTVAYSEFFRNPLSFAVLEQFVLPQLAAQKAGRGEVRVWSAGCAAGQEPYSVAILLDELRQARQAGLCGFRIFATERSEPELMSARQGVYSGTGVQNVRLKQLRDCFVPCGDLYAIVPRLRERVEFSVHDLLDNGAASPPAGVFGDFDLVLCCNLLFYYRQEAQEFVMARLCRAVASGGYLMTGETERAIVEWDGCFRELSPGSAVFRKVR